MKKLLLSTSLLFSLPASAAMITEVASFGTQGSSTDVQIGTLNQTLTINGFDTSLGTLTGVDIKVFGQINSRGSSKNVSDANGRADIGIMLFSNWAVTSSAANTHVFQSANFVTPFLSASSAPTGVFNLIPNSANDTFAFDLTSGELSASLTGINLAAFTTGSAVDFLFSAFANTTFNNDVASGTGQFTNTFETGAWGKVEVSYTFDSVATVSEPKTFALFGLTLAGLAFARKKRSK